jgi:dipeptidase E
MRLYLSSFRIGEKPQDLVSVFGYGKRVAIIANATDTNNTEERLIKVQAESSLLQDLGFKTEEIDLRKFFLKSNELRSTLHNFDCIWVRGGNVFLLRRAFRQSGFDEILKELLNENRVAYGGYSAGVCILAPTLKGLEFVDDPYSITSEYESEVLWDGLEIIPYSIAPHYKSLHPESANIDKCIDYFEQNNMPYEALKDGEVILVR